MDKENKWFIDRNEAINEVIGSQKDAMVKLNIKLNNYIRKVLFSN